MIRTVAALLMLAVASFASAQTTFTTTLLGSREVPVAGDPDGSGVAVITFFGNGLQYYVGVRAVQAPTAAHIHVGRAGEPGAVVIPIPASFAVAGENVFTTSGFFSANDAAVAAVLADPSGHYVNVHNGAFPGGALRGQLLGEARIPGAFTTDLHWKRVVPTSASSDGGGYAALILDGTTAYFYAWAWRPGENDHPTGLSLFQGAAGQPGSLVRALASPLNQNDTITGSVILAQATVDDILARPAEYFLEANPGVARGQLAGIQYAPVVLPVAAHNPGLGTSYFRTDIRIQSLSESEATVWAEWFPTNTAGLAGPAKTVSFQIAAESVTVYDDAVVTLFGATGRGAIRLSATGPIHAVARTYNDQRSVGAGTFGQFAHALAADGAFAAGSLPLASHHEKATGVDARFNIGYFNPNPTPASVDFHVRQPSGAYIVSQRVTIPPYGNDVVPYYELITAMPPDQRTQGAFFITYGSGSPIYVFGSLVDNRTDDGLHQGAMPMPPSLVPKTAPWDY